MCVADAAGKCTGASVKAALPLSNSCDPDVCYVLDSFAGVDLGVWNLQVATAASTLASIASNTTQLALLALHNSGVETLVNTISLADAVNKNALAATVFNTPAGATIDLAGGIKGCQVGALGAGASQCGRNRALSRSCHKAARACYKDPQTNSGRRPHPPLQAALAAMRPGKDKVMVIMLTANPTDTDAALTEADAAKKAGTNIIALGSGSVDAAYLSKVGCWARARLACFLVDDLPRTGLQKALLR